MCLNPFFFFVLTTLKTSLFFTESGVKPMSSQNCYAFCSPTRVLSSVSGMRPHHGTLVIYPTPHDKAEFCFTKISFQHLAHNSIAYYHACWIWWLSKVTNSNCQNLLLREKTASLFSCLYYFWASKMQGGFNKIYILTFVAQAKDERHSGSLADQFNNEGLSIT